MTRPIRKLALGLCLYLGSYLCLRATQAEVWDRDQKTYVLFPAEWPVVWYAFRPLTYLDAALTGMKFHIGPHR